MPSKYTDSNFNQIAITGPFGFPLKNTEGVDNEIRVAKKDNRYALAIKTDNAWRYFDENLKVASASTLGLIKVGSGLSIDAAGVLSATGGGGSGTITGVTAGTGLSGGGTSGTVTLTNTGVTSNVAGTGISVNAATGAVTISVSGLTVSELAANSLQTSGESFSDNDTSLMTSAAIQDKIQSFSYITLSSLSASAPITYDNSSGAFSVADHAVTLAKLPEIATSRILGRTSSSTGDIEVLTLTQVSTMLNLDNYLTAPRTVTAGGNTLATSETLAFTAGSNVTITESGGAVTIASTDTNTDTVDMGDGFRLVDVDSNVQVTENKYVKFKTASGGSGFGDITGGDGSSGNRWIYQLQYTDTNTTYSIMGSGNSYAAGLVLAGASSHGNTYLRKDGTWDLPSIHIQDDDGDSLTVDIDEHIKITGTGGITTDWTTDDAGGSGAPNILTIGVSNITNVGTVTSGVWNATAIASQYLDSDTAHLSGTQTFTGAKTFSAAATMYGLQINAGSGNDTSGQDATLYISATSDNDWGIKVSKPSNNYGMMIDVAADASYALRILANGTQKFVVDGAGNITGTIATAAQANITSVGTLTSLQVDAHNFQSLSAGNIRIIGNNSAAIGINLYASGNNRGWVYSNDSSQIGFLDTSGAWDLRKTMNSHLQVYGSGSTIAKFGSGDAWGRIEHEGGFTNGGYVYSQDGNFRVDGGDWCTYDDNDQDLGESQTSQRWRYLYLGSQIVGGFGGMTTGGTTDWNDSSNARSGAGYTLLLGNATNGPSGTGNYFHSHSYEYSSKTGAGNMCQFAIPYIVGAGGGMYMRSRYDGGWGGWVNFHDTDNMSGVARTSNTYGSFNITNGNGSYPGHTYTAHSNKPTVMFADSTSSGGIYYQGTGRWAVFHNYSHNCLGVDTSSTEAAYELKVNGDILATGDVVAFSDARWKTEVETISNPIDKIMDMRGVYYRELPKGDKKVSDRRKMGVIAQEMLKVAPEVVTYGEINDEYAVDYSKLVGILIEGIKELKQEINELKGS